MVGSLGGVWRGSLGEPCKTSGLGAADRMEAVRLCCGVENGETEGERVMTSVVITVLVILDVVVFRIIGINML